MLVYRQEDFDDVSVQLRQRRLAVYIPAALVFAFAIVSYALRWPQAVTDVLTIIALGGFFFCYFMLIAPVKAYRRHIDHALRGKTHEDQGAFVDMEPDAITREGLRVYPMHINVGAGIRDDGMRQFYFDANLPRPDWQEGETLILTSYDNVVVKWTRVKIKS